MRQSSRPLFAIAAPALLSTLFWSGASSAATDAQPGAEMLYKDNCVKCHGSEVFTRPNRKIDSYAALGRQVRWCETNLELRWFDEDIDAVAKYLNDKYYKFTP